MTFVTKSYDLLMTTYVGRFELNNSNIPNSTYIATARNMYKNLHVRYTCMLCNEWNIIFFTILNIDS